MHVNPRKSRIVPCDGSRVVDLVSQLDCLVHGLAPPAVTICGAADIRHHFNQCRHVSTKRSFYICQGDGCVLHHVMQQGVGHDFVACTSLRHHARHAAWRDDIRITTVFVRLPNAGMGGFGRCIGTGNAGRL
ncbi:hypothetical protein MSKU15_0980 [Komagataeibacter diospyri]|nr:hypothetical protein MSKU15_0980 [Komagataeibacter diospyri]